MPDDLHGRVLSFRTPRVASKRLEHGMEPWIELRAIELRDLYQRVLGYISQVETLGAMILSLDKEHGRVELNNPESLEHILERAKRDTKTLTESLEALRLEVPPGTLDDTERGGA